MQIESSIPMTRVSTLRRVGIRQNDGLLFIFSVMFAFLISFEHVFDLYADTDTVLKPYRIVGIFIILLGMFNGKNKWYTNNYDKYWVFYVRYSVIYTILISAITTINFEALINDALQIIFNILVYLSLKKCEIDQKRMNIILKSFILGVLLNTAFVFFQRFVLKMGSRPSGFSDNPNSASFSMAMVAILFVYYLFDRKGSKMSYFDNNPMLSFAFSISVSIFLLIGMAIEGSRGGFITLAIGVLIIVSRQSILKLIFALLTMAVLVTIFAEDPQGSAFGLLKNNPAVNRLEKSTDDIRLVLWKAGINAITDSYFMGIGMGQFRSNMEKFAEYTQLENNELVLKRLGEGKAGLGLHNLFMEVAVECGVIGLILILLFFYRLLKVNWRRLQFFKDYTPYFALVIGILFFSFTGRNLLTGFFWFSIYLCSLPYTQVMDIFKKKTNQVSKP